MTDKELEAFNRKMFDVMAATLAELPMEKLIDMHASAADKYDETEGSDEEAPVSFALSAISAAIKQKKIAQRMN